MFNSTQEQIDTTYETMRGWIESCKTQPQLAVTHDAVINLFDNKFKAAGTQLSENLHALCMHVLSEIKESKIEAELVDMDSAYEAFKDAPLPGNMDLGISISEPQNLINGK